jgi:hypothetical protein
MRCDDAILIPKIADEVSVAITVEFVPVSSAA